MKNRLVLLFAMFALACMVALGADISGKWVSDGGGKGGPQTFNLKQAGSALTGSVETQRGAADISNGKVDGDKIYFEVTRDAWATRVSSPPSTPERRRVEALSRSRLTTAADLATSPSPSSKQESTHDTRPAREVRHSYLEKSSHRRVVCDWGVFRADRTG